MLDKTLMATSFLSVSLFQWPFISRFKLWPASVDYHGTTKKGERDYNTAVENGRTFGDGKLFMDSFFLLALIVQLLFSLLAKGQTQNFRIVNVWHLASIFIAFCLARLRKYKLSREHFCCSLQMLRTMENRMRRRGWDPIYPDRFWINQCFVGFRKSFL